VFVTAAEHQDRIHRPRGGVPDRQISSSETADGGIHMSAYDVPDIIAAARRADRRGARGCSRRRAKIGAHGKAVLFFHPKDFSGALRRSEQA